MGLAAGLRATVRHVVTEADTAIKAGSGDVPVLGTPRLLALAEAACVAALEPHLDPGMTSVGTRVALEHRRASPAGTLTRTRNWWWARARWSGSWWTGTSSSPAPRSGPADRHLIRRPGRPSAGASRQSFAGQGLPRAQTPVVDRG
jgi:hypothetical protein